MDIKIGYYTFKVESSTPGIRVDTAAAIKAAESLKESYPSRRRRYSGVTPAPIGCGHDAWSGMLQTRWRWSMDGI